MLAPYALAQEQWQKGGLVRSGPLPRKLEDLGPGSDAVGVQGAQNGGAKPSAAARLGVFTAS